MTATDKQFGTFEIGVGNALPLGAHERDGGVNFAVFSRHATCVILDLFNEPGAADPYQSIELNPKHHRTGDIWHVWVGDLGYGSIYAWRADGPYQPEQGHRFNPHKALVDPYARALVGTDCWDFACACGYDPDSPARDLSCSLRDDAAWKAKCLISDGAFDWQGDRPLKHPWSDTIIYETHIRGLTVHPSSAVRHPGTFLGVAEKIPYFRQLGITAIELMPVQEFHENELLRRDPVTGERLRNYWGYSTVAFFAPKESYASRRHRGGQLAEFKTMVRELHRAGIEVILDIVFNHTAEGDETGPTLTFRGLDNRIYYLLDADRRFYKNYSGCGNTLNCNHPVVRDYILDCLRYWVVEMHVDGFRFDLASVLGRDEHGNLLANPPLLERIAEDPVLRDAKLIAEAWDAAGAYQVGNFPGQRWSEWNGRFRDDVRRFWRGDSGLVGALASRIAGSADIYQVSGKQPVNSINFVTSHDGFTLNDLVSYRYKHNEANGEGNADGAAENYSENHGVEGETDDPAIEALRVRQIKNFLATLLIARGVPMLLGGDEFRRTQRGNNNAYCQDNELSWHDWTLPERHPDIVRFVRGMIHLRRSHGVFRKEEFYAEQDIHWFNERGAPPFWDGPGHALGCRIRADAPGDPPFCLLFNAGKRDEDFILPAAPQGQGWRVLADTASPAPHDIFEANDETSPRHRDRYPLRNRSMAVLIGG